MIGSDRREEIYLDYAAATPVDPRVAELHASLALRLVGNANNDIHLAGRVSSMQLASAARDVADLIGGDEENVLVVPSASIALFLALEDAISRCRGTTCRILASAAEHPALLDQLRLLISAGRAVVRFAPVDRFGQMDLPAFRCLLGEGVDVVCAMAANNETGTVVELDAVLSGAADAGALTIVDGAQAAGRVPVAPLVQQAAYFVLSGAKMYGPRQAAALVSRFRSAIERRARHLVGSPDAAGAGALGLACRLRQQEMQVDEPAIAVLRDRLEAHLLDEVPDLVVNGDRGRRLSGFLNVSAPHVPGDAVVARLCGKLAIATGAACQSGVPESSHVLRAMGGEDWVADGAVRLSLGKFTRPSDVETAAGLLAQALRGRRPARLVA